MFRGTGATVNPPSLTLTEIEMNKYTTTGTLGQVLLNEHFEKDLIMKIPPEANHPTPTKVLVHGANNFLHIMGAYYEHVHTQKIRNGRCEFQYSNP